MTDAGWTVLRVTPDGTEVVRPDSDQARGVD
jgi:hypothetical protein